MAPIGHLRIKEAVPSKEEVMDDLYFSIDEVINRGSNFLDYAAHRGAIAGGATGAGGEAPKLLLRHSKEKGIWIDTLQDNSINQDKHYLVKYPRGARTEIDCNILRAEYYYYHVLHEFGFNTIDIDQMRLEEGIAYPSLWIPRFDVRFNQSGQLERLAMESVYSVLNKEQGSYLEHSETIRALIAIIENSDMVVNQQFKFNKSAFVIEWVKRNLLNIIFGNSDNHARNTAFIRYHGEITLAPIYDFAPMAADPEGVVRTIKWPKSCELGGRYHFGKIVALLSDLVDTEQLWTELRVIANQCLKLENILAEKGVPTQILTHPNIGFFAIKERLNAWGLLE
ncbi:HipA domain-containing protein [Thorsellia anophelis]|uniref:Serine/threonine-protein kinase HipA n=1 Tax=Thorsellia anophelis DSM 18579 TaxID=1123402 RepID=A0A1H9Z8V0_9GAMM|nr:HipA domain-containing protein [Thorsellia anophelis]SES78020.1 serine/threonine-protein kinase HipA [Thorsellia anophelis DSM 18579]